MRRRLRVDVSRVTDPRSISSYSIRPGLGDPAPYCDCSRPDLVSASNFVTMLVSMQYLLIVCRQYCARNDTFKVLARSNEVLDDEDVATEEESVVEALRKSEADDENRFIQAIISKLKSNRRINRTASTTTTTTTTTPTPTSAPTTTTPTTTTTSTTSPTTRTSTETTPDFANLKKTSLFEKYFASIKAVKPILQNFLLNRGKPRMKQDETKVTVDSDEDGSERAMSEEVSQRNRVKKSRGASKVDLSWNFP